MIYSVIQRFVWWPCAVRNEKLRIEWVWWRKVYLGRYLRPDGSYGYTEWCTSERLARGYAVQARLRAVKAARQ